MGAAMVFLLRGGMKDWVRKLLLGFASGVMIAGGEPLAVGGVEGGEPLEGIEVVKAGRLRGMLL